MTYKIRSSDGQLRTVVHHPTTQDLSALVRLAQQVSADHVVELELDDVEVRGLFAVLGGIITLREERAEREQKAATAGPPGAPKGDR